MANKPIFVATHPRACSTAFERVFMTRRDILQTVHEPFGDAYYFGPERLAARYEHDPQARDESGFADSTYKTIMDRINRENTEGKRLFIKDMAQYFIPPTEKPVSIAPSLIRKRRGVGTASRQNSVADGAADVEGPETAFESTADITDGQTPFGPAFFAVPYATDYEVNNPTVVPQKLLEQFHWTFLIRHPRNSIPSYYRCCVPPLSKLTGFNDFRPDEAGYDELRRLFDYLLQIGFVGPQIQSCDSTPDGSDNDSSSTSHDGERRIPDICVIDADDLLDNPDAVIRTFCANVGIEYSPKMLIWDDPEGMAYAQEQFEKWRGFHEDAIHSRDLKPRQQKRFKTDDDLFREWTDKFGEEGARTIRKTIKDNVADYEYLKQFAIKI